VSGGSKSGNPDFPLDNPLLVLLGHSIEVIQLAKALAEKGQRVLRFIDPERTMNEPGNISVVVLFGGDSKLEYAPLDG
jgi:hypothetical protein